jgi:ADP-dependent phosphofructokinase/glucokinase
MIYADNKNADALRPLSRKELSELLQNEFKDTEIQIIEKTQKQLKKFLNYLQ